MGVPPRLAWAARCTIHRAMHAQDQLWLPSLTLMPLPEGTFVSAQLRSGAVFLPTSVRSA